MHFKQVFLTLALIFFYISLHSQEKQPNIIFIMGDDIGWFNIGAYHRGIMAGRTPNIDKLAQEGMLFTDYYAEPSCTAGRANFMGMNSSALYSTRKKLKSLPIRS